MLWLDDEWQKLFQRYNSGERIPIRFPSVFDEIKVYISSYDKPAKVTEVRVEDGRIMAYVPSEDRIGNFMWWMGYWVIAYWDRSREANVKVLHYKDTWAQWVGAKDPNIKPPPEGIQTL